MFIKKLLAAFVFVSFLAGGVAAPIGISHTGTGVFAEKAAHAQAKKPEKEEMKKGKVKAKN